jgi:glycosyltransferase involved in cell wall biosynthesis
VKLCFLCTNYPPEIRAGTEMVAVALARELCSAGHEVFVVCTSNRVHAGEDLQQERFEDVPVFRLFKKLDEWDTNGLHRPRLLQLVDGLLRAHRPALLHAHALASFGSGQLQQARALGIPSLLTFHDLWVTCPRYFRLPPEGIVCPTGAGRGPCVPCVQRELPHAGALTVQQALAARDRDVRPEVAAAAVLTAPSRTAAAMVQEHLPWDGPIEVVPHGVLEPVPTAQRARAPQPGERLRVGTFGNLVPEKGVLELVVAAAGLDCELHLAGPFLDAGFEHRVRARAGELAVRLVCDGPYGASDHPARGLHLAVFPSRCQETYGLVVDEALAHGVPVLCSDGGAFGERAAVPGVVVAALPSLRAALHDLVTAPQALARLRAAIPDVLPSVATAAARYRQLYERALARAGR